MEFAPPEQYGFAQTDCRADIFSFGVLLCWLLTGNTKVDEASIKKHWLGTIIKRCTAFSPDDRYRDVITLKRALLHRSENGWRKIAAIAGVLFVLIAGIGIWQGWGAKLAFFAKNKAYTLNSEVISAAPVPDSVKFSEPLIEQAVRTELGKSDEEAITSDDLGSVTELCIFADKCAVNYDAFSLLQREWNGNKGTIESLDDLALLPNLRILFIAAQNINDISPVAGLKSLVNIELRFNPVSEVSALSGIERINSNRVLVPVSGCFLRTIGCSSVPATGTCIPHIYQGKTSFLTWCERRIVFGI